MYSSFASESVRAPVPLHSLLSSDESGPDKKTLEPIYYVDVKSERLRDVLRTVLRDVLRTVLRDVRAVNLNEDKPSV